MNLSEPILLSLRIAFVATVLTLIIGGGLSFLFVKKNIIFKDFFESIILLPMVLPPSVMGYLLLIFFGKRGPAGILLEKFFGVSIVFNWVGACIAATVVSIPLMYQGCKGAFISVDSTYENAARTLGATEFEVFRKVTVPLAWPGIVGGIVMAFARSIGEFGATLMVAGNIPGKTETIPLAIFYAVETGELRKANILMGLMVLFSFILIFSLNNWLKKKRIT